jgi:hypothetical protein
MSKTPSIRFLSCRFDEAAILGALAKVAFSSQSLEEIDYGVLAALQRSSPEWNLPLDQVAEKLNAYDEDQIAGLVSNVKGILHEMEFQVLENSDGDSVFAALFPETNHQSVDVQLFDQTTNESWEIQLKATESPSLISSWMESNPDTEILVTEEIAERMDLKSSGLSNDDLTIRVEDFVDKMQELETSANQTIWSYFPLLPILSSGIIVFELWRRYRHGVITIEQFKDLTLKTLGIKAAKYATLMTALLVPGLNIAVGTYLLASLVMSSAAFAKDALNFRPFGWL